MSATNLLQNKNLSAVVAGFLDETESLAHVSKTWQKTVAPHFDFAFLNAYAHEPSLKPYVERFKALPTPTTSVNAVCRRVMQDVREISGGVEYLDSLHLPTTSPLHPRKLTPLSSWIAKEKARNLVILFTIIAEKIPEAKTFLDSLAGDDSAKAEAILTWMKQHKDMLSQITELNFWNCELTLVPDEIAFFSGLLRLDLTQNRLCYVSALIYKLPKLQYLFLTNNRQLTTLSCSIHNLTQLKRLDLWGTSLTSLPDTIGDLAELGYLNLAHLKLTTLPSTLCKLTKLKTISFYGASVEAVPRELQTCNIPAIRDHQIIQNALPLVVLAPTPKAIPIATSTAPVVSVECPKPLAVEAPMPATPAPSFFEQLYAYTASLLATLTQMATTLFNWLYKLIS